MECVARAGGGILPSSRRSSRSPPALQVHAAVIHGRARGALRDVRPRATRCRWRRRPQLARRRRRGSRSGGQRNPSEPLRGCFPPRRGRTPCSLRHASLRRRSTASLLRPARRRNRLFRTLALRVGHESRPPQSLEATVPHARLTSIRRGADCTEHSIACGSCPWLIAARDEIASRRERQDRSRPMLTCPELCSTDHPPRTVRQMYCS